MLPRGVDAPDFELPDQKGEIVRLSALRGRVVVLYFYPADFTPGCTREAYDFGTFHRAFEEAGADVLGVSGDDVESHRAFAEKCRVPYRLLADPTRQVLQAYDAIGPFGIPWRITYVLDRSGRIAAGYSSHLRPGHHAHVALEAVRALPP